MRPLNRNEIGFACFGTAMMEVPRLALATAATGPEPSVMALALLAGLTEKRWRVQHFRTRAYPTATELVGRVTGLPGRHLDSWLMPEAVCRSLFVRGTQAAELAVVEGTLATPLEVRSCSQSDLPGDLRSIAQTLYLPVLAVVSLPDQPGAVFHLPRLPDGVDGVLIDRLADPADLPRLSRLIHLAFSVPVLGALEAMPTIRRGLEGPNRDELLSEELLAVLAANFLRHCDLDAIGNLARSRPFPAGMGASCACGLTECCRCFRVAYAQDEAFGRYFPDTLEALEALGAELVERDVAFEDDFGVGGDFEVDGFALHELEGFFAEEAGDEELFNFGRSGNDGGEGGGGIGADGYGNLKPRAFQITHGNLRQAADGAVWDAHCAAG